MDVRHAPPCRKSYSHSSSRNPRPIFHPFTHFNGHLYHLCQVEKFRSSPAIFSWYIADEPDGAGTTEGPPIGISLATVKAAFDLVKSIDPYHPISLVLNCKYSAPLYAHTTDILMVDPYPVSINTSLCSDDYGCCGCDDCTGSVTDVSERMDLTAKSILYR